MRTHRGNPARRLTRLIVLSATLLLLAIVPGGGAAAPTTAQSASGGDVSLAGPFVHANLAIWVVRGKTTDSRRFITLDEGLAAKTVVVREKGSRAGRDEASVNELEIENTSDRWLFLQAGDVVRGGKQDRTIGVDVTLGPGSGPQPISAFCVEHGRWAPRAGGLQFSGNTAIVSGNALKMSIQGEKNQARVWEEVAKRDRLAAQKVAAASPGEPAAVTLSASGTYNAIVDHAAIRGGREEYVRALAPHLGGADALGIVVAINGRLTAADVYASNGLFRKLSKKLLDSYALDASLRSDDRFEATATPRKDAVLAFVGAPSAAQVRSEKVGTAMHRRTREADGVVLFEYVESGRGNAPAPSPVHKSYLSKSAD
jgi:hypothetical protein